MKAIYRNDTTMRFQRMVEDNQFEDRFEAISLTEQEFIDLVNDLPSRNHLSITNLDGNGEVMTTMTGAVSGAFVTGRNVVVSDLEEHDIVAYLRRSSTDSITIKILNTVVIVE